MGQGPQEANFSHQTGGGGLDRRRKVQLRGWEVSEAQPGSEVSCGVFKFQLPSCLF